MMAASCDLNDANQRLFAGISSNPEALVDSAFNVQKLVEQGKNINEVAFDAPLVLGARAFARAHLDKVPSPARTRSSFFLTRQVKSQGTTLEQLREIAPDGFETRDESICDDASVEAERIRMASKAECFFIGEDDSGEMRKADCEQRRCTRRHRKPSIGAKLGGSLGLKCRGRPHRSKSRRRTEGATMSCVSIDSESTARTQEQLLRFASSAEELEEAKKRLAQLEEDISTKQALKLDERIRDLEEAEGRKDDLSAQLLMRNAQQMEVPESQATLAKIDVLERVLAEQAVQIATLVSKLAEDDGRSTSGVEPDALLPDALREETASEIQRLKYQAVEMNRKLHELAETRERVEHLDRVVAQQASQIMVVLGESSGSELGLRTQSDEEVIEHEFDLVALQKVCRALYSDRAAKELLLFNNVASQALLVDLARRFPLAAGLRQVAQEDDICASAFREDICFEAVD